MEQQWLLDLLLDLVALGEKYTPIINELLNSYLFQSLSKIVIGYALIFWVVLVIWTTRDIIHRTHNILLQMMAILLVVIGNIFGLIFYLLLRPSRTLMAKYDEEIERKALFNSIEVDDFCSQCRQKINSHYLFCPNCQKKLKNKCTGCGNLSELNHQFCNQCGKNMVEPTVITEKKKVEKKSKLSWFKKNKQSKKDSPASTSSTSEKN